MLETLSDAALTAELKRRGYVVRHRSEARKPLSWNRTLPFPDGLDFEVEALAKIREGLTARDLHFDTKAAAGEFSPAFRTAYLLVI